MRETEHHRCISHLRHNPTASGSRRFVAPCNAFDLDAIDEQSLSWCNWLPVPRRRRPCSFAMHLHPRLCLFEASQLVRFFSIEPLRTDSADWTWAADPTSIRSSAIAWYRARGPCLGRHPTSISVDEGLKFGRSQPLGNRRSLGFKCSMGQMTVGNRQPAHGIVYLYMISCSEHRNLENGLPSCIITVCLEPGQRIHGCGQGSMAGEERRTYSNLGKNGDG